MIGHNPLVMAYLKREIARIERIELERIVLDLRKAQAEVAPLIKAYNERREANMRQDGPRGFVVVRK